MRMISDGLATGVAGPPWCYLPSRDQGRREEVCCVDIYQGIVDELSVPALAFDEDGVCAFEIRRAGEQAAPFVVNLVARTEERALVLSVTTASELPERLSRALFLRFGEHALAPLHHGDGVGIYPGTSKVSFFASLALESYRPRLIKERLASLLERAHEWEAELALDGLSADEARGDPGQSLRV